MWVPPLAVGDCFASLAGAGKWLFGYAGLSCVQTIFFWRKKLNPLARPRKRRRERAVAPIGLSRRHELQAILSFAWLPDGSPTWLPPNRLHHCVLQTLGIRGRHDAQAHPSFALSPTRLRSPPAHLLRGSAVALPPLSKRLPQHPFTPL